MRCTVKQSVHCLKPRHAGQVVPLGSCASVCNTVCEVIHCASSTVIARCVNVYYELVEDMRTLRATTVRSRVAIQAGVHPVTEQAHPPTDFR